ncbi:MAG TPA: hypothetical protein VFQ68_26060 [Streptosporangiaceae bacterium]|nr:hypothetical protein [Streptosporangiaceae bacterium]
MDPLSLALLQVDWSSLDHAYGPAADAPGQLLALAGDDPEGRSGAVGYLDAAMLHQGSVFSATAPFIKIAAMLLAGPGTAVPVADIFPWDPGLRPLRVALLDCLAVFAEACQLKIPGEDLIRDAYPAGPDEADLQRIYRARRDWRPDRAARTPPPPAVMEAVNDAEYRRAMYARSLIACREVVPDVFEAVLPLITGPGRGPAARHGRPPPGRPAARRAPRRAGLRRARPGVSGDQRATRELAAALEVPQDADRWFTGHLPGQENSLHCDLAEALAARASDLEAVLPAALGLVTASNQFTYDRDLAPFIRLAFPQAPDEQTELTTAQRTFLTALVANGHQPFDQALCLLLLGT